MNTLPSRPEVACAVPHAGTAATTLNDLANGSAGWVRTISNPAAAPEWAARLEEVGFIPGERVMVMARGLPGGDPLVVRVGNSTFALRRAEAACVHVSTAAA